MPVQEGNNCLLILFLNPRSKSVALVNCFLVNHLTLDASVKGERRHDVMA